ncbi:MAG: hypothetical protein K8S62_09200 [Candidatus Sabulitectum sp.]|nr:hypothetical protein [Candidatus Sabulitectum sp.]
MSIINIVTVVFSNVASVLAILLVVKKYIVTRPFKQGADKGYLIGFSDGVRFGIEKSKDVGRRKDDSRSIEILLKKPQIRSMLSRYGDIEEEYTKESCFHAITKEYMIYMYTGLHENIDIHISEIEKRIKLCEADDKYLLVIMVLTNVNVDIASARIQQFKNIKSRYKDNDRVYFDKFIEYGLSDKKEIITDDEITKAAVAKLGEPIIRRELYFQDDEDSGSPLL